MATVTKSIGCEDVYCTLVVQVSESSKCKSPAYAPFGGGKKACAKTPFTASKGAPSP